LLVQLVAGHQRHYSQGEGRVLCYYKDFTAASHSHLLHKLPPHQLCNFPVRRTLQSEEVWTTFTPVMIHKAMEMSLRLQEQLANFYWLCHLLLHFLDCISDLWTAWRSGAVQRMSRKLSRTQPGNKASIPVYLKPWMKVLADFLETPTWALVPAARWEGSKYKWESYVRNAGIRYSI